MKNIVNFIFEMFIYICFLSGICILYEKKLRGTICKIRTRNRLRERRRRMQPRGKIEEHINCIMQVTLNKNGKYLVYITVFIYIAVFVISNRNLTLFNSIIVATSVAITPYALIRIRFEGIRRKGSFEGEIVVSNFLNQYRISNFNVYESLEKMLEESQNTKISNSLILKMLLEIRNTGNPIEIKKAVESFAAVLNTNWSRMLAYNIQIAALKGINVSLAVEDILIQLRDARAIYEERKRINSEAMRIVVYMIPLLYLFTIIMSIKFIGINLIHYLENQFLTKEGFMFFIISSTMFVINIATMEIVNRQKFDY